MKKRYGSIPVGHTSGLSTLSYLSEQHHFWRAASKIPRYPWGSKFNCQEIMSALVDMVSLIFFFNCFWNIPCVRLLRHNESIVQACPFQTNLLFCVNIWIPWCWIFLYSALNLPLYFLFHWYWRTLKYASKQPNLEFLHHCFTDSCIFSVKSSVSMCQHLLL